MSRQYRAGAIIAPFIDLRSHCGRSADMTERAQFKSRALLAFALRCSVCERSLRSSSRALEAVHLAAAAECARRNMM